MKTAKTNKNKNKYKKKRKQPIKHNKKWLNEPQATNKAKKSQKQIITSRPPPRSSG
jgi:hypothetical protein